MDPTTRSTDIDPTLPPAFRTAGGGEMFSTLAGAIREGSYRRQILEPGTLVRQYEVLEPIGRGGMSSVYRARHRYLDREVALKTVPDRGPTSSEVFGNYLLREAQVLARVDHAAVLRIHDAGLDGELPFVIVELLRGESLQAHLGRVGPLPARRVLDLLEEVIDVVGEHERLGIVHRDLKPDNIWVRRDGSFCVLDYGLAMRHGRPPESDGNVTGTPAYMSPEQAAGSELDVRSDLFSLGLVARTCLRGRPDRRTPDLGAPAPTPLRSLGLDAPRELCDIVDGMTRADANDRYARVADAASDVAGYRYRGRRPAGPVRGSVFLAMPFSRRFDRAMDAMLDACFANAVRGVRVDRVDGVRDIWSSIEQEIHGSRAVIADLSPTGWTREPNVNVVTEAAHARAIGRPLILVTTGSLSDLPFDWQHVPAIRYRRSPEGLRQLERELGMRLRHELRATEPESGGSAG